MDKMELVEKILNERRIFCGTAADVYTTEEKNKDGEQLYYVKDFELERSEGTSKWKSKVTYYAYNKDGFHVATALVKCSYYRKAVIEYETVEKYRNKGNMTILCREIIKDVFENDMLDGLKTDKLSPLSSIESIELQINPYNLPSLSVAKKLGFDEFGYLKRDEYYERMDNNSKTTTQKRKK